MKVLDISDWNDHINWSHMIDHGVEGVIVKISEGRTLTSLHGKHIAAAAACGLPWGVYCYTHAQTEERAEEEAQVVMDALEALGYGKPELGIWFDVEDPAVLDADMDSLTAICSAFIVACNHNDYSAGIYASLSTLESNIRVEALADYVPYWCAQYNSECDFSYDFPLNILKGWQYTDREYIDGAAYDMSEWY